MVRFIFTCVVIYLLGAAQSQAGVLGGITVSSGNQVNVGTINLFSVAHFDMTGIVVTAHFSNGSSQSDAFETVIPGIGQPSIGIASSTNFRLIQQGDTFESNAWNLENLSTDHKLVKLVIEGAPGNTIFDLKGDGALPLTPGRDDLSGGTLESERGWTFEPVNLDDQFGVFPNLLVNATYSDIVKRSTDASPVGDIWATLTIEFGGLAGGLPTLDFFGQGVPFRFYADTDVFDARDDTPPVPEPSSLTLMAGFGLVAACRFRRKPASL